MSDNQNNNNNNVQGKKDTKNYKTVKTNIMDLEKLKLEYSSQLNAYKQAVANYVNYLQQNENAPKSTPNYTTISGKAFWGSGQAGTQSVYNANTTQQCQALCAKTSNCSGATFNPDVNGEAMCWLRTGEGELVPALDTDNAIIPQAQAYLITIESINNKLIATNQQIQKAIDKSQPVYNSIQTKNQEKNQELIQNYKQLVGEREKIAKMLNSYQDLDESQMQGELKINQKYYTYIFLVIITIGVVVLLYKFSNVLTGDETQQTGNYYPQTGGELSEGTSVILLTIIIFILIGNYYTNIKITTSDVGNSAYSTVSSLFSNITNFFSLSDNF
jgi:hypothetical protein